MQKFARAAEISTKFAGAAFCVYPVKWVGPSNVSLGTVFDYHEITSLTTNPLNGHVGRVPWIYRGECKYIVPLPYN